MLHHPRQMKNSFLMAPGYMVPGESRKGISLPKEIGLRAYLFEVSEDPAIAKHSSTEP